MRACRTSHCSITTKNERGPHACSRHFPRRALALGLVALPTFAAELQPSELLKQAETEQQAYLETLKSLVAVDTGTGQEQGLATVSQMLVERLKALGAEVTTTRRRPRRATISSAR